MNDNTTERDDSRYISPLIGFAAGALVGGALALLFAPASGAKTRRRLGEAGRQLGSDARHSLDDARHTLNDARDNVTSAATGLSSDVKAAITAGREAFRHDGRTGEPLATTPTRTP